MMDHKPRADVVTVVKNVKGRLLRREESYTETSFPESAVDEQAADDLVMSLKARRESEVYNFVDPINVSPALERNVKAWSEATGLLATVTVRYRDRVFRLHEFPLVSRSGYFKLAFQKTKDVTMASDEAPVGVDVFELALNFCYGSTILMEPTNVAEIFCVANFLQMSEEYGRANLCERSELYLTQVALQSWDDALVVLLRCENLVPNAEQLGIVDRCLDAMAFMACVEMLDPVARKTKPGKTGELQCWDMRASNHHHWWIHDVVTLPPKWFVTFVLTLRREGMQENHVGQVVTAFADRWLFGDVNIGSGNNTVLVQKGSDKCWVMESQSEAPELSILVESVVRVLPLERNVVPIGFLVALLRRGLKCVTLHEDCRIQLETRIALQFEHATLHDLLLPSKKEKDSRCVFRIEVESMERILKLFLTRFRGYDDARVPNMSLLSGVGKLWDEYLTEIAFDSSITPARFAELVERIPAYMRVTHDHVYRAIHTYLKAHPGTTQEDRLAVCRALNCQKLSPESCAHVVQNDLMPLRLVVQAMFMQQLQSRSSRIESTSPKSESTFRDHHHHPKVATISASSHRRRPISLPEANSTYFCPEPGRTTRWDYTQDSTTFRSAGSSFREDNDDLYIDDLMYAASQNVVAKEMSVPAMAAIVPATAPPKSDYQVTESRLRSLEAELSKMRVALAHSMSQRASTSSAHPPNVATMRSNLVTKSFRHSESYRTIPLDEPTMAMSMCCGLTSHLQPGNRTGGTLLAKTLHKLRFLAFGKAKSGIKKHVREPVISAPIVVESSVDQELPTFDHPESFRFVNRNDSMPRLVTNRVQNPTHHVRHKSFS